MKYKTFLQLWILSVFLLLSGCAGYYYPNSYEYDSRSHYYTPAHDSYRYSYPGFSVDRDFDDSWARGRP